MSRSRVESLVMGQLTALSRRCGSRLRSLSWLLVVVVLVIDVGRAISWSVWRLCSWKIVVSDRTCQEMVQEVDFWTGGTTTSCRSTYGRTWSLSRLGPPYHIVSVNMSGNTQNQFSVLTLVVPTCSRGEFKPSACCKLDKQWIILDFWQQWCRRMKSMSWDGDGVSEWGGRCWRKQGPMIAPLCSAHRTLTVRKWSNPMRLRGNLDNLVKIKSSRQMGDTLVWQWW